MSRRARTFSLQRRLLVALLGGIALVWLATAVLSYLDARHELDELLDAHLAQSVSLLLAQTGHELEEIDTEHMPQLHRRARSVAIQIWEGGAALRLRSASAPLTRLSARDEGFSDTAIEGKRWRVFSGWDAGRRYLVQVGERYEARDEIAADLARNLLLPLLFALPFLGLLVWFNVARALRPLAAIGGELAARDPGNLLPLDVGEVPQEVTPLVENLNRLFERVSELIANERRFTADAAHELRTPLAALKTQAQVAQAAAHDAERARALENVIAGCDRATHLVQQLLTLARIDPDAFGSAATGCDLQELARAAVAELAPFAVARQVEIDLAEGSAVQVSGHAGLIAVLLRNLVDNAIRYSPQGGAVHVGALVDAGVATIRVADAGPGIPAGERARVGQRFYRIPGSGEFGSGLGLSIVKRIAELHRASLRLGEGAQGMGLAAEVRFPKAASLRP